MPPRNTPATPAAKKKLPATVVPIASNDGHMSVNQMHKMLGRDRATIMRWIRDKCPVVQKADANAGVDWILDIGDVMKWREQQIAREAVQKRADDGEAYDDPKDLVSLARMQMKLEEERRQLVKLAWAITVLQRCLGLVRQSVMALPLRILDLMPGIDSDEYARIHTASVDLCVDALVDAQKEINDFMAAASRKGGVVEEEQEADDVPAAS